MAKYRGIPMIGVKRNTSKTDIMWKNELFVLADISLAVHIIAIIQKKAMIQTITITRVSELFSGVSIHSKFVNVSI